ncbi:MAG: pinensin family lanthipeptide [Cyclobacteriaceae bacterium]
MKKSKISLKALRIKSFVTNQSDIDFETVKGGDPTPIIIVDGITEGFGGCVPSVNISCPTQNNCGSTPACTAQLCQDYY